MKSAEHTRMQPYRGLHSCYILEAPLDLVPLDKGPAHHTGSSARGPRESQGADPMRPVDDG